ncbi:MAG: glycosyltransferase [Deltaproteobacteria bacterium]|nr:glycosyltransferase [Deltaproteobacteria bacterium]
MKHIAICICTFKRPAMLNRLIASLKEQETDHSFYISITVVDNDREGSAAEIVAKIEKGCSLPIHYVIEPQQNISLARNRALTSTEADYYACIDDDELADKVWLLNHYKTIVRHRAAGVLGPVRPIYDIPPPAWLIKGRILERKELPTGTALSDPKYCRTGNVLFSRELIAAQDVLFDPSYGRTGGEDCDFFRRMINSGYKFVWCNEALVHEVTSSLRQKRSFYLRRALLRGVVQSVQASLLSLDTLKSFCACAVYTLALPFVFIFRNRSFMPILIRDLDHVGKILARCGIKPIKSRSDA